MAAPGNSLAQDVAELERRLTATRQAGAARDRLVLDELAEIRRQGETTRLMAVFALSMALLSIAVLAVTLL